MRPPGSVWLTAFFVLGLVFSSQAQKEDDHRLRQPFGAAGLCSEFVIGGETVLLIVDTGAEISALENRFVSKLDLEGDPKLTFDSRSLFGTQLGRAGANFSVQLGRNSISSGSPFVFLNKTVSIPGRPEGILGIRPLVESGSMLDLSAKRILPAGSEAKSKRQQLLSDSDWIGLEMTPLKSGSAVSISCLIGEQKLVWILDTGSSSSVLLPGSAARLDLAPRRSSVRLVDTANETRSTRRAQLTGVKWTEDFETEVPVFVSELAGLAGYRKPVDGILGRDFLLKRGAVIDFGSDQVFLKIR
ncbi:MAG: hypothetical protein ACI8UO_004912 [Verrucomicrobiales bacterium]|jgi:hypothetical protein